ncbi:MAG: dimethlysulfonioproprionate lyase DddL, partial [Pseudomonadota bacterium]
MTEICLSSRPSWIYLLREFYEVYRYLPSGGSSLIRAHQKAVREAISRVMTANAVLELGERIDKPVTAHFRRALDEGRRERHADMIRS